MGKIINLFKSFEHYKSIDEMPIYNWQKVQETNDLTWLLKVKSDTTKGQLSILETYLKRMTDEYIDHFGISDQYRLILKLKGELRCLEIDYILSDNRVHLTFIEIKKKELQMALAKGKSNDTSSVKVHAEKYMGRAINMRETSVKEFYEILRELQKEQKPKQA